MEKNSKDIFQYALAGLVVLFSFWLVIRIAMYGLPSADTTFTNLFFALVMGVMNALMLVLGYFFGSSKGSADKTDIMGDQAQKQP